MVYGTKQVQRIALSIAAIVMLAYPLSTRGETTSSSKTVRTPPPASTPESNVGRTHAALMRVFISAERDLQETPQWQNAQDDARDARRRIEEIRKPLLLSLYQSTEYQAIKIELEKGEAELRTLHDDNASPSQIAAQAKELMKLRQELTALEQETLESAGQPLQTAIDDLTTAVDTMHDLRYQAVTSIRYTPEFIAARTQYLDARKQVATSGDRPARNPRRTVNMRDWVFSLSD